MTDDTIASIERATLAAVPPADLLALDGWLVALDRGSVGRAHSAVPTRHSGVDTAVVPDILAAYAARQLRPAFRVPDVAGCRPLCDSLATAGLRATQPTLVQVGTAAGLLEGPGAGHVELADAPGQEWASVFLGPGFDPVDGASRVEILRRSRSSVFGSVRRDGSVVAVGSACFSEGWCGVHGMRTEAGWRGRGYAGSILHAFAHAALARGVGRVLLQVEQKNEGARALYARAGLQTAWRYDYWRPA